MQNDRIISIGNKLVGENQPCFVIAEIGINHNASVDIAKKLIDGASISGCDCVKFQKRTPEICVPKDQWSVERDTIWGRMTYIDYRHKMEFSREQFGEIVNYCSEKKILWSASCWDQEAVDFVEQFEPKFYKVASACITDNELMIKHDLLEKPVMISTGMSTLDEIENAVLGIDGKKLLIAHSTSAYPCKPEELNLRMITTLREKYPSIPVGYSGHEVGLAPTWAAVALGASFVERHITLDRAMWGTDQAASVEISGFMKLVSNIRDIEKSMGDGVKKVYQSEISSLKKLRRVHHQNC